MFLTKKAIPRRTFLKSAQAALALPLLDAMIPAATAWAQTPAKPVPRLGFVFIPMGCDQARWTPPGQGKLDELSPILSPLKPVKDQVTVITNMRLQNAYPGTHDTSNSAFLSAATSKHTESSDYYLGTTVDQIAAKEMGRETQLASLQLAMDLNPLAGVCNNGYSCVYQNCLSWSSPTTPLPSEAHPRVVFERLFGEGGNADARRAALRNRASLLDSFTKDIARFKQRVGAPDRVRLDQYLDSVRQVEREIERAEQAAADNKMPDLDRPVGVPAAFADHAKLMFDLQILAFQADITRVITFQLTREQNNRTYPEIGVGGPAPSDQSSRQRSGKGSEDREDQYVPCFAVFGIPAENEGHSRWRRLAPRSLGLPVRQRHGESQPSRSRKPSDPGRRRRRNRLEGRPAHPVREGNEPGQPPPHAARSRWHSSGFVRGQHRKSRRPLRAN